MKTIVTGRYHSIINQPSHNTISWIGHYKNDPAYREAGQLFKSPEEGDMSAVEIFSDLVQQPGQIELRFYDFDNEKNQWGHILTTTTLTVEKKDSTSWLSFNLDPVHLRKGLLYGFILRSDDAFVALGDAAWSDNSGHHYGREWTGNNYGNDGCFYDHFSLAYKIDFMN